MRRLLFQTLLFLAINIPLYFLVASIPPLRYDFTNDTTKSVLLAMTKDAHYDLLVMGTSHARLFSNDGTHKRLEEALGLSLFNIGKDGGHGGVLPEFLFLSRFYEKGNSADTLLYLVDPWVFFSPQWNENAHFLEWEPADVPFLVRAVQEGASRIPIINNLQYKLDPVWLKSEPLPPTPRTVKVPTLAAGAEQCAHDIPNSYQEGLNRENFTRYSALFERTIDLAEAHGVKRIVFVVPTTICPSIPGKAMMIDFLSDLKTRHPKVELYDLSRTMNDPAYFYDYNHLNFDGMEIFTREYLVPLVGKGSAGVRTLGDMAKKAPLE